MCCISGYRLTPLTYLGERYTPQLLTPVEIVGIGVVPRANKDYIVLLQAPEISAISMEYITVPFCFPTNMDENKKKKFR